MDTNLSIFTIILISLVAIVLDMYAIWPWLYSGAWTATCIIGAILGDWKTGLIVGGTIQTLAMSTVNVGGVITAPNTYFAGAVCTVLVIKNGISLEMALAIGASIAVIPTFLDPLRQTLLIDMIELPLMDKAVAKGDTKAMWLIHYVLLPAMSIVWFLVLYMAAIIGGQAFATEIIAKLPAWLYNGFTAVGGILPALGFATFLFVMGKERFLPFFFIGFFISKFTSLSALTIGILAVCFAFLYENIVTAAKGGK